MRRFLLTTTIILGAPLTALAETNVLFILADDMGTDASPCHAPASDMVRMPTLKSLCESGMVFDNAHAYPTCSPSRASFMTGLYASRTGVGSPVSEENGSLSGSIPTIFDHLTEAGYASATIGKWHLSADRRDGSHTADVGIPYYYGPFGGGVRDYERWNGFENGTPIRVTEYTTTAFVDKAEEWIDSQTQPWFLWLAMNAPHTPFHAPPSDLHSFGNLNSAPQRGQDARENYFASLEALDTEMGRLLDGLSQETRDNTIVVFGGDNGTPGQIARRVGLTKEAKGSLYQGGTHVPLVFSGPGVKQGRNDDPVQITDLFETILGIAGSKAETSDSYSLYAALSGGEVERPSVYIEHFSKSEARGNPMYGWAMNNGDYALIAAENAAPELYNMANDELQTRNLAQQQNTVVEQMTKLRAQMLN